MEKSEIYEFAERFGLSGVREAVHVPEISYKEIFDIALKNVGSFELLFDIIMKSKTHRIIFQFATNFDLSENHNKRVMEFFCGDPEESQWVTSFIGKNQPPKELLEMAIDFAITNKNLVALYDIARYSQNLTPDQKRRLVVEMAKESNDSSWERAIFRNVPWLTKRDKEFFWKHSEKQ